MALAPGTPFGRYAIVEPVGSGGMGEVYRARDPRLDRDVAIKVLPELSAADPERLARFEREAKTLAALNHPHIAQIFGIEDAAVEGGRRIQALVMELVEGEDLAERLRRGRVPIDESLAIARQVAEALEAAHERGIVHRDLKPANIKLRGDGTVKVLDFGLAKAVGAATDTAAAPGGLSGASMTVTSPAVTQHGVILGTAAYMAPEQAKGKPVDRRVDIFAFGCVLFELLSSRRAFDGETVTEVLAAVLTRDPDWRALPAATPLSARHLLARCLEKDPRRRLRDIGEARIALEDAGMPADPPLVAGAAPALARRRRALAGAALLLVAAAAAAGYAAAALRRPGGGAIVTSFAQITDQPGVEHQPTISPDGKSIVYVSQARGNSDLYLLRVGGRKAILLTEDSAEEDISPAFSPDGARLAFRSERDGGGIFIMEATGESVRRVTDAGYDPRWSPDGKSLVVADERVADPMSRAQTSHIWVVSVADGSRRRVLGTDGVGPRWSPNGHRIVFWGRVAGAQRDIGTVAADGSQESSPVFVTSDAAVDWSPTWSPDGRFIYFASSRGGTMNLWRVAVDERSGRTLGDPEPVTTPTPWSGGFEFSADGRSVVFADLDERTTLWAAGFDPAAGALADQPRQVLHGRAINSVDVSPDGRTIAFSQRGQPWESLGLVRTDGTGWSRLTDDRLYHRLPTWTPDALAILFYMNSGARGSGLWTIRPDGSGLTEMKLEAGNLVYPVWSPDGSRVAASADDGLAIFDVTVTPARLVRRISAANLPDVRPYSWSPDGRLIAGMSRTGQRDELMIVDAGTGVVRVLVNHANSPAWLPDSRRVVYSGRSHLMVYDVPTGAERPVAKLERAFDLWGRTVSLSRDGRTLVFLQSQGEADVWLMTLH